MKSDSKAGGLVGVRAPRFSAEIDAELSNRAGKEQASRLHNSGRHVVGDKRATDLYVAQQAIAGDPHAQEQLLKMYALALYRRAFAILRSKEDAQDAPQDSWFRAYSNLRSFEGRSSFSTWLTQIVINSALMILRRNLKRREVSTDEGGETTFTHQIPDRSRNPEETLLESERKAVLNDTIRSLRPRIRMMVELGPLLDRSPNEAANRLASHSKPRRPVCFTHAPHCANRLCCGQLPKQQSKATHSFAGG
jgi:RNA polymerase sigma-70 factor (ECF subfamily)